MSDKIRDRCNGTETVQFPTEDQKRKFESRTGCKAPDAYGDQAPCPKCKPALWNVWVQGTLILGSLAFIIYFVLPFLGV